MSDGDSIKNKEAIEAQKESQDIDSNEYYKLFKYEGDASYLMTVDSSGSYMVINKNELSLFEHCQLQFKDSFYLYRGGYFHLVKNERSGFGFKKDTLVFDFIKFEGASGYYYKVDEKVICN